MVPEVGKPEAKAPDMETTTRTLSFRARAALADAISRGFAYPVSDFYTDLASGDFLQSLMHGSGRPDRSSALYIAMSEIESGIQVIIQDHTREDLESEYIGLFEHNKAQSPLHLFGGLYLQSEGGRLETLQRLITLYRSCGLEMEDGSEHADHLTVVLEFLGLLYRHCDQLQSGHDEPGLRQARADIRAIVNELAWTRRLDQELAARGGHPFYLPLSRLLQILLVLPGA